MATKLTLQINSLEALEKLLSGDVQLEMDMRNTVVQEYAKKYIKSVAQEFVSSQNRTETEKVMKGIDLRRKECLMQLVVSVVKSLSFRLSQQEKEMFIVMIALRVMEIILQQRILPINVTKNRWRL